MTHHSSMAEVRGARQAAVDEAVGLLIGTGFTLALFFGMAYFENFGASKPVTEIEDVRMVAMPLEAPPPLPTQRQERPAETPEANLPFSGLEIGASDSPVRVAVVPPDLETMIPMTASMPKAMIRFNALHTDLKPRMDIDADVRHVYQDTEVDQRPQALVRTVPPITADVSGNASSLRVKLLILIGQNGKPENVRLLESSGNSRFDTIVANTVQEEWLFSPGIRQGKKVRVLAQQAFRITFSNGTSPFSVN